MTNVRTTSLAASLLNKDLKISYTPPAKSLIKDKTVLVTGAGGSIGSEIVNQVRNLGAKNIICVDRDEYTLYKLQLTTTGSALLTDKSLVLADIQHYHSVKQIMKTWQPDIVFHAAAVKHLPLLERSPDIAVLTNVLGTENVIRAAVECGVERVVNISTDKAASPSSVLGYTKRLAEMIARDYSDRGTLIASVRFGNVFASRGSFIETMQWQIANKKAIILTDPDVTRYFMSIPQAACLVIEAARLATSGHTYVLDMGEPVKIIDLVDRYAALTTNEKPTVIHGSLRSGEKKHEVLFDTRETYRATSHKKISAVTVPVHHAGFMQDIHTLYNDIQASNISNQGIREILKELISPVLNKTANAKEALLV